jgi:predicted RND superfamily exporter protein
MKLFSKILKKPRLIIGATAIISVFFALQIPRVQIDNNNLRFVPENDAARKVSAFIDDTFGSSLFILVGLERKYGEVFDKVFLDRIKQYVDRIEEIEIVGDINSIINADYITGKDDTITVEKLVGAGFSGTAPEIAELKRRILSWDIYKRSLISDDFKATQIYIPLTINSENAGDPEVVASYLAIRDVAREMFNGLADVYVTGMPVISGTINEAVQSDLLLLIPVVIAVLLVVVFIPLKRIGFVALSMLAVIIAVIWTVGAMPLFNVKMSVISTVLPVVLMAIGSSYGIHIIIHYIEDSGKDFSSMTAAEHREFVAGLMEKLGGAILLAAVTTFVSFLSFCFTRVLPIREFGYFSAFGVFSSFLIAVTLTPAILILRGPKALHVLKKFKEKKSEETAASRVVADFFVKITARKYRVLTITALAAIISVYGVSRLIIDNIFIEYFRPDAEIARSDTFIREKFGGSKIISVVVQAENSETLLHPDCLNALENLDQYLMKNVEGTGKILGFTDLVKRVNQVFNASESPLGLKPAEKFDDLEEDDDFGFDGFGFDGFSDELEKLEKNEEKKQINANFIDDIIDTVKGAFPSFFSPEDDGSGYEEKNYIDPEKLFTPKEMVTLLDRAAHNGDDPLWELKKLVNYEGAAYYEIPSDPARYGKETPEDLQKLVSNYLILISSSISSYANDPLEPTAIKSAVQLRTIGQGDTDRVVQDINAFVAANFPKNVTVTVGGTALVEASTNTNVVQSLWSSMIIALVSMFIIIAVYNRSIAAGLIAVLTLGVLILLNFAIMGFAGIKLNMGTALIASLTMGIGIDYTIHYLEAYKREYRASGGQGDFLKKTYLTSGVAIITDAASVAFGFLVLLFSRFVMLAEFGLLVAVSMALSALAGLILIPVLLSTIKPKFIEGK